MQTNLSNWSKFRLTVGRSQAITRTAMGRQGWLFNNTCQRLCLYFWNYNWKHINFKYKIMFYLQWKQLHGMVYNTLDHQCSIIFTIQYTNECLKECFLEGVCGETRGINKQKETWWWNEEVAASARVSGVFGVKNAEKSGPDAKKLDIGSHWWCQENGKNGRNPCCWRQIKTSPVKI